MNLRITNNFIFRSDQPNLESWKVFAYAGVQGVICLREDHERDDFDLATERNAVLESGIAEFVSIPCSELPMDKPLRSQINQAIELLDNGKRWLIHCRRGADRTGLFIACYRIAIDKWSKDAATKEALTCGMSRLEFAMHEFLEDF